MYFDRANRGLMDHVGGDGRVNLFFDDGKAYCADPPLVDLIVRNRSTRT